MSAAAMAWAKRQKIADHTMKTALTTLAWAADAESHCWPSQARIAAEMGVSDRAVRSALKLLESFGLIERKARSNGRSGRTSDMITVAVDREFTVTKPQAKAARRALLNPPKPSSGGKFQPEQRSSATGTTFQGKDIEHTFKNSYQGKDTQGTLGARAGGALALASVSLAHPVQPRLSGTTRLRLVGGEGGR